MERDERILRHIGRYRVSINAVIERQFFDGGTWDHVLQRLAKRGRLQTVRDAIPGNLNYYHLPRGEARRLGFPDPPAAQERVLRRHLAILWFCCMTDRARVRLHPEEHAFLGTGYGLKSPHVIEKEGAVMEIVAPKVGGWATSAVSCPGRRMSRE